MPGNPVQGGRLGREQRGDDEPVPLAERPETRALIAEPDPHRKLVRYAAIGRSLWDRTETYLLLVTERGWSHDQMERWLARTAAHALL